MTKIEIEKCCRNLWLEILGTDRSNLHDNFFALGGDELLFHGLIKKIGDWLKLDCSDCGVDNFSTLYQQISFIDNKVNIPSNSIIVKLKDGDEAIPLVFIHAIGGTLFSFMRLINKIETTSIIYGIQDCILFNDQRQYTSLEEQASFYTSELLKVLNAKNILIGGYSSGGSIACEMSYQLQKRGIKVRHLFMFDSWAKMPFGLDFRNNFKNIILRQFDKIKPHLFFRSQMEIDVWLETMWNRMRLVFTYQPKIIGVNATLFVPKVPVAEYKVGSESIARWSDFLTNLKICFVEGTHENLLDDVDISPLINRFNEIISLIVLNEKT